MISELRLTGLTAEHVRAISRTLAQHRDLIPTYNNGGSSAEHWAPIVIAEGDQFFTLITPRMPPAITSAVVASLQWDGQKLLPDVS